MFGGQTTPSSSYSMKKIRIIGNKMTDYKGLKDKIAVKEIKFVIFINI